MTGAPVPAVTEIDELRQRLKVAEAALVMFCIERPVLDPLKLAQAYFESYPQPLVTKRTVNVLASIARVAAARGKH